MTLLNPHDWRLETLEDGASRVHQPPIPDHPELRQPCVRFTCLRCGAEKFFPKAETRQQPPKYGCQG
jgi:hypothetical protein